MRNNAFEGCWNLDTIRVYSDSVPTLASNAFRFLPKTCKKVNERAMQECEDMETLVLGDGMENRRRGGRKMRCYLHFSGIFSNFTAKIRQQTMTT